MFLISVFLVRERQEIQNGCHHLIRPRCLEMTRQCGCCTTVVGIMRCKLINKNEEEPTFICNNFHAKQALSISLPSCSSRKQKACYIFSFTLILLSVDDVILEYKDIMT